MPTRHHALFAAAILLATSAGCSDDTTVPDATGDRGVDQTIADYGTPDTTPDAPGDGPAPDLGVDGAADHGAEAGGDATADHGAEAGGDATADHGAEAGGDASDQGAPDQSADVTSDGVGDGPLDDAPAQSWLDCRGIYECTVACGTDAQCAQQCADRGTPAGSTHFGDLMTCLQGALAGACAVDCADPSSSDCTSCLASQCQAEFLACIPPIAGFGDVCSDNAPCPTGLGCLKEQPTDTYGYCTRACEFTGYPCTGGPPGTNPVCLIPLPTSGHVCGFICELDTGGGSSEWPCPGQPTGMVCSSESNPPCGGTPPCQYFCEVAPQ